MRSKKIVIIALLLTASFKVFAGSNQLNIAKYLSCADEGIIHPSEQQLNMLRPFMPEYSYRPAPAYSDREYWNRIAKIESGQACVEDSIKDLNKKPEVPITDAIYRRANKEGNRKIYKPRYYRTMGRLENAVIAECIENSGQFLPQIIDHIEAILDMKSWLHPNHDDNENSVLERKRVAIDLGARKFGSVLMLAELLLEDKLPGELRAEIRGQIQWRMIDSYLKSCRGEDKIGNQWIFSTSNWNSVCTGGTLFSVLSVSDDFEERLAVLGSALNSMKYYLSGFGEDGYCSEGVGYWNYGFGNYLYLSQMIFEYTDGKINLFEFTNPKKMNLVGNLPEKYEIHKSIYPCFSDSSALVKGSKDGNFAYWAAAKYYDARKPAFSHPADILKRMIEWNDPVSYVNSTQEKSVLPTHTYFDDFGVLISRGQQQERPFSVAVKAGHNAENHNHSDVGSYLIVYDTDYVMCGDIGAPSYVAGAFSKDNPARSSWGHPVPRVNGQLQSNGIEFRGEVIETAFEETEDKIVMNIAPAYEVAELEVLTRGVKNDKSALGQVTIEDHFESSKPIRFGTAVMTFAKYEILDNNTLLLKREGKTIRVDISSEEGDLKIVDETVPVEHLRNGKGAVRIGIDFKEKQTQGTITMVFTPLPIEN